MEELELILGLVEGLGAMGILAYAWVACQREKAAQQTRHDESTKEIMVFLSGLIKKEE